MVNEKNIVTFCISEQVKSFQSLQEKISSYETENFVKRWIKDSRSIGAAQGRVKRKLRNQILRIEVCWYTGGKKFKQHGKGARQTSFVVLLTLSSYIKTMQKLK